ncbi:hypothetical protein CEXT_587181 [Caerostris extrusa]|uniref:Uncharacterized protein n=1 Tax=Caerostris extrusa TaxID=172846 RepID=A0AAV4YGH2_CAEEX|nr:hypothetical protein CEXT_587181 [Caerostris extrusa]
MWVDLWVGRVFWRRLALDLNHLLSKPSICPVSSIFSSILPSLLPPSSKGAIWCKSKMNENPFNSLVNTRRAPEGNLRHGKGTKNKDN